MSCYRHLDLSGATIDLPVGKVVCVGRNYLDHIQELNNEVPTSPLLFMKPTESLVHVFNDIQLPNVSGECHNELEIAVLIGQRLSQVDKQQAEQGIWGLGLGLDLTLRDVQNELKQKGQPWERAKAFDGSCPVSGFVPADEFSDLQDLHFSLKVNHSVRQQGHTKLMMVSILELIVEISQSFTLSPGDIVLTGTPKGVGPLKSGDLLELKLDNLLNIQTKVA